MDKLIELHLHLDGSLRPETVWELAKEQNIKLPANTVDEVRDQMQVPEDCRTLEEYLTRFDLPLLVLQTREALERAAFELTEDLAKEGVTYAEIRFAPQLSIKGGMTQEQAVEAAIEGVKRGMEQYPSIRVGLILCCMRGEDTKNGISKRWKRQKNIWETLSARWILPERNPCIRRNGLRRCLKRSENMGFPRRSTPERRLGRRA